MSHLPTLISDLALILVAAGVVTLIFKRLKQPLVLGYIVAGVIAGPHISFTPTVIDTANIQTWADIGVVFLLFALGLDFSFKKLMKVGGTCCDCCSDDYSRDDHAGNAGWFVYGVETDGLYLFRRDVGDVFDVYYL